MNLSEILFVVTLVALGLLDIRLERRTDRGLIARGSDFIHRCIVARRLRALYGYSWRWAWHRAGELTR